MPTPPWHDGGADVTIRRAVAADARALRTLAELDEEPHLAGDVLVAEVGGELWAALALAGGRSIADPFRPTAAIRQLLAVRRRELVAAAASPRRFRRLGHRFAT